MRRIQLLIALTIFSFVAIAQTKTNVKVENTNGTIHLKIEKVVDGKTTTIDKIYNSLEEMKNDPELEGINLHIFNKGDNEMVFFEKEGEEGDHKINVVIDIDADGDHDFSKESGHSFMFRSDLDDGEKLHDIKVWVDEDGIKHISRNGEEIEVGEVNSWTDKEGNEFIIEKLDGKVMIMLDGDVKEFKNHDGAVFEFKFDTDDAHDGEHKVMMFKSKNGDGEHETVSVKLVEHIIIHLKEVEANEFASIDGINAKNLKMDDLNYYPNPNSGKFTLQFTADKRPTEIKITSLDGKEIYSEKLSSFEGSYQNEIDLSGQKRGIYLLQIIQGNKASNKKIIIE